MEAGQVLSLQWAASSAQLSSARLSTARLGGLALSASDKLRVTTLGSAAGAQGLCIIPSAWTTLYNLTSWREPERCGCCSPSREAFFSSFCHFVLCKYQHTYTYRFVFCLQVCQLCGCPGLTEVPPPLSNLYHTVLALLPALSCFHLPAHFNRLQGDR